MSFFEYNYDATQILPKGRRIVATEYENLLSQVSEDEKCFFIFSNSGPGFPIEASLIYDERLFKYVLVSMNLKARLGKREDWEGFYAVPSNVINKLECKIVEFPESYIQIIDSLISASRL